MATTRDIDLTATSGEGTVYPEDVYVAEFVDFTGPEDLPAEAQTFGPAVKLVYEIAGGDYAGEKIDELASLKSGIKAKLRQRAEALRGAPYAEGEGIRLVPLIGKRCKLVVKTGENGYSKIESALPMPAPRAARPVRAASVMTQEEEESGLDPDRGTAAPAPTSGRKF